MNKEILKRLKQAEMDKLSIYWLGLILTKHFPQSTVERALRALNARLIRLQTKTVCSLGR